MWYVVAGYEKIGLVIRNLPGFYPLNIQTREEAHRTGAMVASFP
jgi:hypothetical protein